MAGCVGMCRFVEGDGDENWADPSRGRVEDAGEVQSAILIDAPC